MPIKSKPPIEKVPVVQEKKVETLKPIPEATTKLELEAASKIEMPDIMIKKRIIMILKKNLLICQLN
ncbi:hypothetical protein [Spiroplasma endosymbiont of Seladonia tumulorum]|uniref:hypothetical protein n=1 Tax=Spiroplasma endosymbiont of Seladonia tumulorum TaxID=3066321 RepID=UPI0030D5A9E3